MKGPEFDSPEKARAAFEALLGRVDSLKGRLAHFEELKRAWPKRKEELEEEFRQHRESVSKDMALYKLEFEETYRNIRESLQNRLREKESELGVEIEAREKSLAQREKAFENEQKVRRDEIANKKRAFEAETAKTKALIENERTSLQFMEEERAKHHRSAMETFEKE